MTKQELRDIAASTSIQHAEFCLEQHTSQVGHEAAEPLWIEMAHIIDEAGGVENLEGYAEE